MDGNIDPLAKRLPAFMASLDRKLLKANDPVAKLHLQFVADALIELIGAQYAKTPAQLKLSLPETIELLEIRSDHCTDKHQRDSVIGLMKYLQSL
ncbi:MAG: hypothetical protein R3C05_23875 [Pirellulaceae bacterium]